MSENVLVTGCSGGIGSRVAWEFARMYINNGSDKDEPEYNVFGYDIKPIEENDSIGMMLKQADNFEFRNIDVSKVWDIPRYDSIKFQYIINCAGCQTEYDAEKTQDKLVIENKDIDTNLTGLINICEYYAYQDTIKAVVNLASASGHTGAEFPRYAASKGGVLSYTKALAMDISKYGATANSISFGGVVDSFNDNVMQGEKWEKIMEVTPLKKWCTTDEAASWIYFLAVKNKSMTGQDIVIDNGEMINSNFVW